LHAVTQKQIKLYSPMMRSPPLLRFFSRFWPLLVSPVIAMSACSPKFDWRVSKAASYGDAYVLQYPGKPVIAQRTVVLAGITTPLTLHGVQVDHAQFAFGHAPAASPEQAAVLATALVRSFATNMGNASPNVTPLTAPNALGGYEFTHAPTKPTGNTPPYGFIRVFWTASGVYEVLAVRTQGDVQVLPSEVAEQFIESFRFEPK
jgi:hypothetical protein